MLLGVALTGFIAVLGACTAAPAAQTLVIHEWGTFTSFQDSAGTTIGGINVDDEPVPSFVHRLKELPIWSPKSLPASWSQGAPRCHPDITLRLETPVVYFYPGDAPDARLPIDFHAEFRGGWLTEYFPYAKADNPDFPHRLAPSIRGRLQWRGLRLGESTLTKLPQTSARVWLAPRKVAASVVTAADGEESEKYLFYRGVGHIDAPLVVRQRENVMKVALRAGKSAGHLGHMPPGWLVRVFPDGRVWYSVLDTKNAGAGEAAIPLPAGDTGASQANLKALQAALRQALIGQGLFADEAQAMLETWELSYFKSEGLRLFFLLPRSWIEHYLPISVSSPARTTRVMLGRIELISPFQQENLAKVYKLDPAELQRGPAYAEILNEDQLRLPEKERAQREKKLLSMLAEWDHAHTEFYETFGREVPAALKLYNSMGRFRDALLAHQLKLEKDNSKREALTRFMVQFSACLPSQR